LLQLSRSLALPLPLFYGLFGSFSLTAFIVSLAEKVSAPPRKKQCRLIVFDSHPCFPSLTPLFTTLPPYPCSGNRSLSLGLSAGRYYSSSSDEGAADVCKVSISVPCVSLLFPLTPLILANALNPGSSRLPGSSPDFPSLSTKKLPLRLNLVAFWGSRPLWSFFLLLQNNPHDLTHFRKRPRPLFVSSQYGPFSSVRRTFPCSPLLGTCFSQ